MSKNPSQKFRISRKNYKIKFTSRNDDEKMIGTKLADVVEAEEEVSEDETEELSEAPPLATRWEEMHDVYFTKPILFSHAINTSVESLREDEEECALNLSNMYGENKPTETQIDNKIEDDTLDVIDDLIKSFEKDISFEAVPIVNVENE